MTHRGSRGPGASARAREVALDTFERLQELFADVVTDEAELTRETTAKEVPEWDSLSHVRLKKFGDLVDLVQSKSAK